MSFAIHAPAPVTTEKAVEVLETKQLREATASAPAVVSKKISIAPLLRRLGFSAVGITLTAKNTRMEQMKGGRHTNPQIAEHLAQSIRELLTFLDSLNAACQICWVYEKHENGSPHAHAIAFIPQALKGRVSEKIAEYLGGGEAISRTPRTAYLLKQLTHSRRVKLDLGRKTKYAEDGKRYECAKIKGVQAEKKIRYAQNTQMTRNFKETAQKLRELMTKIDEYGRKHRTGKRRKAHTALRQDAVTLFDFVLYPTSEAENKAQARAKTTHARAKETAEAKRLKIGEIGEDGQIKIAKNPKKSALNVHLRAANGEKLHISGKNISVSAEEVAVIKRKCRKMRSKKQMMKLALVWKSQKAQKIENEGGSYDETFFMSLDFESITAATSEPPPKIT
jgi:hypothetical protein|nr:hypothetical protein [uncultured Campylobacter sp.]